MVHQVREEVNEQGELVQSRKLKLFSPCRLTFGNKIRKVAHRCRSNVDCKTCQRATLISVASVMHVLIYHLQPHFKMVFTRKVIHVQCPCPT